MSWNKVVYYYYYDYDYDYNYNYNYDYDYDVGDDYYYYDYDYDDDDDDDDDYYDYDYYCIFVARYQKEFICANTYAGKQLQRLKPHRYVFHDNNYHNLRTWSDYFCSCRNENIELCLYLVFIFMCPAGDIIINYTLNNS